jgi:HK97 gp10 family phage protein
VRIKGKDEFLRQLQALPDAMRAEITKALETSAEETTDLMKRFAPVKTGNLRASIGFSFGEAPKGAITSKEKTPRGQNLANARAAKREADLSVTMYAGGGDAFYARFQEFGTTEMSANPYFYPGYRFGKKRAKSRLSRAIRNGAKKAFR